MADSPSHKLGEYIGDFFEDSIVKYLSDQIPKDYYLDYRHERIARKGGKEVIGIDKDGNKHKLDIVIERNGSERAKGTIKAFIEMAWRRYKKHSKNKVQEISGAIIPLINTYAREMPFYAAILSGEFTENSIKQLESQGFYVLYFTYEEMCAVFESINVSIHWGEKTSEDYLQGIIDQMPEKNSSNYVALQTAFLTQQHEKLQGLTNALLISLNQKVTEIVVSPLHGTQNILYSINDALTYINTYDENNTVPILRYEITVKYNTGVEYTMKCPDKKMAIQFLNGYIE